MNVKSYTVIFLLMAASAVSAQQDVELLHDLGQGQAQRLEEYNSAFLQDLTYFSTRYRIVRVDSDLLLEGVDFSVTPFDDIEPIEVIWEQSRRSGDDVLNWVGHYGNDPTYEQSGSALFKITINMHAWDIDELGNAEISFMNRFEHSPLWVFDENDNPVLRTPPGSEGVIAVGPPPETAEEIERHRRLQRLNKHAFYSVSAVFDVPDRDYKYVLRPLKFTPRYAVIYELARDAIPFRRMDSSSGVPDSLGEDERALMERYQIFRNGLPREEGKEVRGDIR